MKDSVLVLIKPDAMSKGLAGDVIKRLDITGLELVAMKLVHVTEALATEHYSNIKDNPFFPQVLKFITGQYHKNSPVIAMVYRGKNAVKTLRTLAGATNPEEASSHSLRGSMGRIKTSGLFENVLHVSSSVSDAKKEVKLWFSPEELPKKMYTAKMVRTIDDQRQVWV